MIHKAAADDEDSLSVFNHLSQPDSFVHCKVGSECSSGNCQEGVCIPSLTKSSLRRLGPSGKCQDITKPCHDGYQCREPTCNRYGSDCWCPLARKKRAARETTLTREGEEGVEDVKYVIGAPDKWEIECDNDNDCPVDWICKENLCLAPLAYPSAAWAALSAPVVSGIR